MSIAGPRTDLAAVSDPDEGMHGAVHDPIHQGCAEASRRAGEPTIASAPSARTWLCLEQDGPWGRRALTESHLDPGLGARIEELGRAHGIRPALIRRPGRHADEHHGSRPLLMVAHTDPAGPAGTWLRAGRVDTPGDVLGLDWEALAAGRPPDHPALLDGVPPQLLVCTNGRRDTCCARLGRPVALAAAARRPDRVWEVTHTSGHRFAPTTVLLPSGHLHGRVLDGAALIEAADAGRLVLTGWRGRSSWPEAGQVAEELVRRVHRIDGIDDVRVTASEDHWRVTSRDGRSWSVEVGSEPGVVRTPSCGKPPEPATRFRARIVGGLVSEA